MAKGRDLFASDEADFVPCEGTTCMLPVGLQKGEENQLAYLAKACWYWESVHVRSYRTCLQNAEVSFFFW